MRDLILQLSKSSIYSTKPLKVSKDAPVEVIQAAYRTLAKKYHPDINK
ncbi:hypothetical protein BXQ27_33845, partial [Klebsiella aerogenes]